MQSELEIVYKYKIKNNIYIHQCFYLHNGVCYNLLYEHTGASKFLALEEDRELLEMIDK